MLGRVELQVSLRGLTAWRMYRAGAHPRLLLDMFPVEAGTLTHVHAATIREVLHACLAVPSFDTAIALRGRLDRAVQAAQRPEEFEFQRSHYMDIGLLRRVYGGGQVTPEVRVLARFASFLVEVGDPREEHHTAPYVTALSGVWFDICDAALAATATVTA